MNIVLEFVSVCPLEQNISISAYFSIPFRSFAILEIYIDKKKAYELLRVLKNFFSFLIERVLKL